MGTACSTRRPTRDWTRAFCEGSYFEGSWEAGRRLRFLDPQGFGMEAVVDENRRHEMLSLRLIGEIKDGRPCCRQSAARGARCRAIRSSMPRPGGGTQLVVHLQSWNDGFTDFLDDTWPKALERLKALSESTH